MSRRSPIHWSLIARAVSLAAIVFASATTSTHMASESPSAASVRVPWKTSRIVGAPTPPEPYRLVPAYPARRFDHPTCVEQFPDSERLLVTQMNGQIFSFAKSDQSAASELVGNLAGELTGELAGRGVSLFDAEFHPGFDENRFLFVCYVHPGEGRQTRVSRFTLDSQPAPRIVPGSERVVITWPAGGHNGGCLEFGKDGMLYISTGDGSGPNPPDGLTTGQTVDDLLGAILRIDVDRESAGRAYSIPSDNPFVDRAGARGEIWSYGLRNPFKFGIDPQTNGVFVADNGWETWELIHLAGRGTNCGWPVMEGRASLRSEVPVGPTPIVPPIKDHPHTEANSVIGGPVYRGPKLPDLQGAFIYGDYITGTIWAVRPDQDGTYIGLTLLDTDQRIVAFTQGSDGELFVLDYDFTGQIYQILPSDEEDRSATFPRRLSETGLFASLDSLTPAPGVIPYDVVAPRWEDGAQAQRWIAIPGEGQVRLTANPGDPATFPDGTVLVKHLSWNRGEGLAPLRLETQLLHYERGSWRPYSYLWDEQGRDATLVDSIGATRAIRVQGADAPLDRTWHVNAVNECKLCHNAGPRFILGFTLAQLDKPKASIAKVGAPQGQLEEFIERRLLTTDTPMTAPAEQRLVNPHDSAASLDDRARSYLHANCAMCHHPGGNAIVSFYLRRDLPFDKLNTNKGTGIGTFGMQDARIIAPGDPYRSVLMYRISKLGYARMPYIGSRVVDGQGVALVEEWIRQLPRQDDAQRPVSAPATSDSPQARALATLVAPSPLPPESSEATIRAALQSTETTLALVAQLHRGRLSPRDARTAVSVGSVAPSDIRGLFETFVPESQRRPTLGGIIDPQVVLARQGDRDRGKLIFFSDGARCRNCHELDDRQRSLGPTLREAVKKYPRLPELLQHVLQPSLKVDEAFAAYTAVVDDGRVINGLIASQSDDEVVLRTADRQVVRIPRSAIEELRRSDKSLMPDGVLGDLTAQEAADLLEFLRSVAGH